MIAHPPVRSGSRVELRLDAADGEVVAEVVVPEDVETSTGADASLVAGWLPAMARREPLEMTAAVSPRLLRGAQQIAEILLCWDRALHPTSHLYGEVPLVAATAVDEGGVDEGAVDDRGVACFFTGGVDSFHTVLTRLDELDELVFVHGFDLPADRDAELNREVSQRLQDAAGLLGLPLVEVSCNLVAFAGASGIHWDDYHGAAMATVAHLLSRRYSRMYVPATTTYDRLYPLGSHPLLDPRWSSERMEIVHDGAGATRVEKLRTIAGHPAARRHLRVCTSNEGNTYNCGSCEKCVRTAVGIRIAGVEGAFETLPPASLRQVASVQVRGPGHTWQAYSEELHRSGANPRLRASIELALARRRWRAARPISMLRR